MNFLLFQLVLAIIFQNTGDIFYLIEMEGFGFASVLVMTFAGQVWLRYKEPDLPRPIRVSLTVAVPICNSKCLSELQKKGITDIKYLSCVTKNVL